MRETSRSELSVSISRIDPLCQVSIRSQTARKCFFFLYPRALRPFGPNISNSPDTCDVSMRLHRPKSRQRFVKTIRANTGERTKPTHCLHPEVSPLDSLGRTI